jgi:hypothetical protein
MAFYWDIIIHMSGNPSMMKSNGRNGSGYNSTEPTLRLHVSQLSLPYSYETCSYYVASSSAGSYWIVSGYPRFGMVHQGPIAGTNPNSGLK